MNYLLCNKLYGMHSCRWERFLKKTTPVLCHKIEKKWWALFYGEAIPKRYTEIVNMKKTTPKSIASYYQRKQKLGTLGLLGTSTKIVCFSLCARGNVCWKPAKTSQDKKEPCKLMPIRDIATNRTRSEETLLKHNALGYTKLHKM